MPRARLGVPGPDGLFGSPAGSEQREQRVPQHITNGTKQRCNQYKVARASLR